MGIDPGEKRIGIAVSDPDGKIAFPRGIVDALPKLERTAARLAEIALEAEAKVVVVGLPLEMDGRRGPEADRASALVQLLVRKLGEGVEVVAWDERLTSAAANRAMAEAGLDSRKRRGKVDSVAAGLMLQSYLDFAATRR